MPKCWLHLSNEIRSAWASTRAVLRNAATWLPMLTIEVCPAETPIVSVSLSGLRTAQVLTCQPRNALGLYFLMVWLMAWTWPAAFNAVKNCATQPLFCMLFQAALTPSMLPFMPYSTSTGVMPNRLALLTCVVVTLPQFDSSLPSRYLYP